MPMSLMHPRVDNFCHLGDPPPDVGRPDGQSTTSIVESIQKTPIIGRKQHVSKV